MRKVLGLQVLKDTKYLSVRTRRVEPLVTAATVLDGQQLGYRTILVEDAARGIDQGRVAATVQEIRDNHGLVVSSKEVVCVECVNHGIMGRRFPGC